jgi:hypothetical protein
MAIPGSAVRSMKSNLIYGMGSFGRGLVKTAAKGGMYGVAGAAAAALPLAGLIPQGEFATPEDYMLSMATQFDVATGPVGIAAMGAGAVFGGTVGAMAGRTTGKIGKWGAFGALAGAAVGFIGTGRYVGQEFARETPTRFRGRGGVSMFGRELASSYVGEHRMNRFNYFSSGQFSGMGY